MHRGKKPVKRKPPRVQALTPQEETALASLLHEFRHLPPQEIAVKISSPAVAEALVLRLPVDDPATIPLVQALRQAFSHKPVQKAIRKTIFKLRQKGLSVPDNGGAKNGTKISMRPEGEEPMAYLGSIDPEGNRALFLALPQVPKGFNVGIGLINDESGILDFQMGLYSKKRMKELETHFLAEDGPISMVEASLPHVATVLERAYNTSKEASVKIPSDYLTLRPWLLENVSLLDQAPIYDHIPKTTVSQETLTDSQIEKLFSHPLMTFWIISPEKIGPLLQEVLKAEDSPILLSETQKAERVNAIKEKAVKELYPESERDILRRRLEEMAYIFFKRDESEYAKLSLMAAESLEAKDLILRANPVLSFLLERSVELRLAAGQEAGTSPQGGEQKASRIILP